MKKQGSLDAVLGVYVGQQTIEGVLLRKAGEHTEVAGRWVRQRSRRGEKVAAGSFATVLPGLKDSSDNDFTIQVGDGSNGSLSGGGDLFLSTEFTKLGGKPAVGGETIPGVAAVAQGPVPFALQLKDILTECKAIGVESPKIAFVIGAPDVSYHEVQETVQEGQKRGKGLGSKERKHLLDQLAEQHPGGFDRDRVAFLPMTPDGAHHRYLAIVPEASEPVSATLDVLYNQKGAPTPAAQFVGTEVSLYAALARKAYPSDAETNTAVVRVGSEDTLILFLSGGELRHYERLRSLTSFDSPETVCSRVMLQQDEHKIGALHHVMVVSEGRPERTLSAFRDFYESASVETLQQVLSAQGIHLPEEGDGVKLGAATAIGAGLRLLEGWDGEKDIEYVNLLPKKLRKKRKQVAFAWHTFAMLLVLFALGVFFTWHYLDQDKQIADRRLQQQLNPIKPPEISPAVLKARVDSLTMAYHTYDHALKVLDSLLIGSDRWSRFLDKASQSTGNVSGIWLTGWAAKDGAVTLDGAALNRTRIAQFARRMSGSIEKVNTYDVQTEVREVKLYTFTITSPVNVEMPYVAQYLRDVALGDIVQVAPTPEVAEDMHGHEDTPMTNAALKNDQDNEN
jgi:hypothetical protein